MNKRFNHRDMEVLIMLASDKRSNEIADELKVSVRTIEARISRMKEISDCKTIHGMVYKEMKLLSNYIKITP